MTLDIRNRLQAAALACALCVVPSGDAFGQAAAEARSLFYTGKITDDGEPLSGGNIIFLHFYERAVGGEKTCSVLPSGKTTVIRGWFRLALGESCSKVVAQDPNLWIEAEVNGQPLPRTQLGVPPYALSTERASGATGDLDTRLQRLEHPQWLLCGESAPRSGALGGYEGAKSLCEETCGSTTAHLCRAKELARIAASVEVSSSGWMTSGTTLSSDFPTYGGNECRGYTSDTTVSNSGQMGSVWTPTGPALSGCWTTLPVLCCDTTP